MRLRHGMLTEAMELTDFLAFLAGDNFLDPAYFGPARPLNSALSNKRVQDVLLRGLPADTNRQRITELRDFYSIPAILQLWSQYKLVFKIDPAFFEELRQTSGLRIPKNTFRHLPAQTMYIDLSSCLGLDPICGVFVHIISDQVILLMETADGITFSFYSELDYRDGVADLPIIQTPGNRFVAVDVGPEGSGRQISFTNDQRGNIVQAIFQTLLFLSQEKADVTESPVTKNTYRPSETVRNKFSEIRMWDVGVRYGKAIRLARQSADASETGRIDQTQRKPPRPHVRCAHWQRYRIGKGRKEIRLNWLAPVFVGGNGQEMPVVIHAMAK